VLEKKQLAISRLVSKREYVDVYGLEYIDIMQGKPLTYYQNTDGKLTAEN